MNKKLRYLHLLFFMFLFVANNAQVSVWQKSNKQQKSITSNHENDSLYNLNIDLLLQAIKSNGQTIINFPDENDHLVAFTVKQTQVLAPSLQKKYASIYSFKGKAIDGSGKTIRFTFSKEFGLKGSINNNNKSRLTIKPFTKTEHFFSIEDKTKEHSYECYTDEININQFNFKDNSTKLDVNDSKLRRYRIAISTTGEYSNYFLDGSEANDTEKVTKVLTAVTASLERINELFEIDLGVTLQLIENNDQLIFLDPSNDPYGSDLNGGLQNELDSNPFVGSEAYDVGHLFHYDGNTYGNAGCIACVCTNGQKGSAFTAHQDPSSDDMNTILAHELGHQFGAYHTQSSTNCASGFNSEVEPGSGSTIMSYAGICSPNVQSYADFYYNYTSIRDIGQWIIQDSNCAEIIDIDNEAPSISAGNDYVIPISTPFVLTAIASDSNSEDVLTYCWEQSDADDPFTNDFPSSLQTLGPVFRSFLPSLDNKRYFPELTHVVNGTTTPWEVLPEVARDLNFSLTVRDNSIEGGQTVTDLMKVTISDESGPFVVTSQNTSDIIWNVGEQVTVTWNVASTNVTPINTALVDIYVSLDGGLNFDTKVLENTENDGEVSFILPDVASTSNARIMVKAVNNVYYAINNTSFEIQKSEFIITSLENEIDSCNIDDFSYDLSYKTFLDFNEVVNISIEELPSGLNYEFSQTTFSNEALDGLDFTLTITDTENLEIGNYSFFVKGISETSGIEKNIELKFNIYENLENTQITLNTPENNASSVSIPTVLDWVASDNAIEYYLELSTVEDFSEIEFSTTTILNNYQIDNNEYNTEYFWRVTALNTCENESEPSTFSFSTVCLSPLTFTTNEIGINFISLIWDDTTNSNWEIEYGLKGFNIGEGTVVETSETNYTFSDLDSGTEYDFYLKSLCSVGESSELVSLQNVTTYFDYCSGDHFYDTGNADQPYSNNENYTTTISPNTEGDRVKAIFNYVDLETGYDYLYVYDGASINDNLIGTLNGFSTNIEFASTHESGALTFIFTSDGIINQDGWDAEIICEPKPNCLAPINPEIIEITTNSAQLIWESVESSENNWEIEYGEVGFIPGEGTIINTSETSYSLDNLNKNTNYLIYLKTICSLGGYSETQSIQFSTIANYCGGDHFYDNGGPNNNYIAGSSSSTTIYPEDENSRVRAVFEYIDLVEDSDFIVVHNGENSSNNVIGFYSGNYSNIEFVSTDSSGALTFEFFSNTSQTTRGWDAEIICEDKPCASPTNIELTSATSSSLSIEWTTYLNNVNNIIEYGEAGFALGSGTELNTENINSITIENLESLTTYDVYIKNSCVNSGYSDYSSVVSFTTQADYCSGDHFYDTGGEFDAYSNFENYTLTIYPDSDLEVVRVFFLKIETENSFDYLSVYDGENIDANLLGIYSGSFTNIEHVSTHNTGALTFGFTSDGSVTRDGWDAEIICEAKPCAPPTNIELTSATLSSLSIEWSTYVNNVNSIIEYGEVGFLLGSGTELNTDNINNITIENLESSTTYDVYIKNSCVDSGYSDYSSVVRFTTQANYCSGDHFYDYGGPDNNYIAGNSYLTTIYPEDQNSRIRAVFEYIELIESTDYIVVYNGANSSSNNIIGAYTGNHSNIELISTDSSGALTFEFISNNSQTARGWDAEIICEPKPNCSAPSNIELISATSSSLSIEWTTYANNVNSIIEYGEAGFTVGSGTELNTESLNNITIENLESLTTYDVYIKNSCEDNSYSDYSSVVSFTTQIDYCSGDHFYDTGGEFDNYSNFENYTTTISPNTEGDRVKAIFNYIDLETGYDYLYVYDGTSINDNLIGTLNGFLTDIEFTSNHSSGALTFLFISDEIVNHDGWDAEIICEPAPNCYAPTNFQITDVATNSVYLNWNEVTGSNSYTIEYNETGFEYGTGNQFITSETNSSISSLESGIDYDFYLVANCTIGGMSDVVGPITIKTLCEEGVITDNEYITDGSFECINTSVWTGLNSEIENNADPCNIPFTGLENSELLCLDLNDNTFYPTDGNFAAYASLYSFPGDKFSISQVVTLPNDIANVTLSFDLRGLYFYHQPISDPNNFTTEFIFNDGTVVNVSSIDIMSNDDTETFEAYEFEHTFTDDVTEYLVNYQNTDVEIRFSLNETESQAIKTDIMLDNVSLIINGITLSNNENEYLKNNITLYPTPNNGTFTISNSNDIKINKVTVYDILGEFIQENTYGVKSNDELFTINNAASGVYFLNIETDKGTVILKTIVH